MNPFSRVRESRRHEKDVGCGVQASLNLSFLLSFSFLLRVLEIAARYGEKEVIGVEALVVVDAVLVVDEAEVEGEAVLACVAGDGSVWMATVQILGGTLTADA